VFIFRLLLLGSFGLSLTGLAAQPNILFLFADDLGRYGSAYADKEHPSPNDIVQTPAFDRIAKEGAIFQNAFISAPSCTPSRAAVYTGRHFFRNGSSSQLHSPWQKGVPDPFEAIQGMPNTLAAAGYHIGWSHKWHLRESLMGGTQNQYSAHGGRINEFSEIVTKADDKAATKKAILKDVRGNFQDFLDRKKAGQPFFYSFNSTNTHRQWVRGSGKALWNLDPDKLKGKLPPFIPDNEVTREDFADYLGEAMAFDAACAELIGMVEKLGELDNTLVVISGDHGVPGFPRGKTNVTDFGAQVLLAIRWPGKVANGRNVLAPVSLTDLAPTFLAAAGLKSSDDPNGSDLLPSLAEGGTDTGLRGWALIGRERHFVVAREGDLPYPVRALRTTDFLYVINFKPDRWPEGAPFAVTETSCPSFDEIAKKTSLAFPDIDSSPTMAWLVEHRNESDLHSFIDFAWGKRPAEELYDLKKDPHQMTNLAADPEYAKTRDELRKRLMDELRANHDPRLDHDAFDKPPYLVSPDRH